MISFSVKTNHDIVCLIYSKSSNSKSELSLDSLQVSPDALKIVKCNIIAQGTYLGSSQLYVIQMQCFFLLLWQQSSFNPLCFFVDECKQIIPDVHEQATLRARICSMAYLKY